jgi:hypothetical protein
MFGVGSAGGGAAGSSLGGGTGTARRPLLGTGGGGASSAEPNKELMEGSHIFIYVYYYANKFVLVTNGV